MRKRMVKLALVSVTLANLGLFVAAPQPAAARHEIKICACWVGGGGGSCIMYFQFNCHEDGECDDKCSPE